MRLSTQGTPLRATLCAAACVFSMSFPTQVRAQMVHEINLTTDDAAFLASQGLSPAAFVDPNLRNPWGMSFGPTSPFWISNEAAGNTTLYTGAGAPQPLVVTIPNASPPPAGPTGQAFVGGSGFNLPGGGTAVFAFANLDGSISAWNAALGTTANVQRDVPDAVYTGLATGSSGGSNYLYAANNAAGRVDVFDQNFQLTSLPGTFQDPSLPSGLTPFNVVNVGGLLFVTYATPGPGADEAALGTGAVDIFNTDGTFVSRFATGGNLLSPWGVAKAPDTWGAFSNAILVGNFSDEDGFINAFANDGSYLGMLTTDSGAFNMPYLWALGFRTGGPGVDTNALYFTAGIGDEEHGLFAELLPVPEPSTWLMMLLGFGLIGLSFRRGSYLESDGKFQDIAGAR
ncbi:TIGR03118 family protein [Sphingomonas limnosediminicola]|uniref:TIGR03118 family protein n=2 Tax=Sphingomonas limnosediminicola TaxID=940133 RepID=A0ABP7L5B5_9SPHN